MSILSDVYRGRKIFVTGNTGFKGSWLTMALLELGARVTGYSLEPPTKPSLFRSAGLHRRIDQIHGDVRDFNKLVKTVTVQKPDMIFHLAAQPLVRKSYDDPRSTYETNIMGTVNVLEAVKYARSVRSCVVVTSDKCYENRERVQGYKETDPMGGHDPYSSSKGCAELVTNAYRRSFFSKNRGVSHKCPQVASVRSGNVIGGGDWAEDRLLPDCVRAISSGKQIIIRNAVSIRPWQYVLDPLYGYLLIGALMQKYPNKYDAPWNFGPNDGEMIRVKDIVEKVVGNWDGSSYVIKNDKSVHEANILRLDTSKARDLLGWRPLYNSDKMIENTMAWYREYYSSSKKKSVVAEDRIFDFSLRQIKDYKYMAREVNAAWA